MNDIGGGGTHVVRPSFKDLKPKVRPQPHPPKQDHLTPGVKDRVEIGGDHHNMLWRPGMNTGERVKLPAYESPKGSDQIRPMATLKAFQMSAPASQGVDITA